MNGRLERNLNSFRKAFNNLRIAAEEAETDLEIDGAIKRFELCYELAWKLIKEYLANIGIICNNPRECFKQAYINGLIESEKQWLMMIDDRNKLVHSYDFSDSREIFENARKYYIMIFEYFLRKVEEDYE